MYIVWNFWGGMNLNLYTHPCLSHTPLPTYITGVVAPLRRGARREDGLQQDRHRERGLQQGPLCVCVCVKVGPFVYINKNVYIYMYIYALLSCACKCEYVYIYAFLCVCLYIIVYIYVHVTTPPHIHNPRSQPPTHNTQINRWRCVRWARSPPSAASPPSSSCPGRETR